MNTFLLPVTENTRTVLLLCALPTAKKKDAKPLTPAEFRGVREALEAKQLPISALTEDASLLIFAELRTRGTRKPVTAERLRTLLSRTETLTEALTAWTDLGVGVLSPDDAAYPKIWQSHLGNKAPDLLFYAGNPDLLTSGGMAFVGSRALSDAASDATCRAAAACALAGKTVVSGGAKGADTVAMESAFAQGGSVVGILPGRLASEIKKQKAALRTGRLLLCSPSEPSAGFSAARALNRNRLIYALAEASFVAQSDLEKGGTWSGATEELSRPHPHPLFVYADGGCPPGCRALIDCGGIPWHNTDRFDAMWSRHVTHGTARQPDLFEDLYASDSTSALGNVAESDADTYHADR